VSKKIILKIIKNTKIQKDIASVEIWSIIEYHRVKKIEFGNFWAIIKKEI
jgi:hypothetical protein